jgi:hypothetical protein
LEGWYHGKPATGTKSRIAAFEKLDGAKTLPPFGISLWSVVSGPWMGWSIGAPPPHLISLFSYLFSSLKGFMLTQFSALMNKSENE